LGLNRSDFLCSSHYLWAYQNGVEIDFRDRESRRIMRSWNRSTARYGQNAWTTIRQLVQKLGLVPHSLPYVRPLLIQGGHKIGHTALKSDAIQHFYHVRSFQSLPYFNRRTLSRKNIYDRQCTEPPAIRQLARHKIRTPGLVRLRGSHSFRPTLGGPSTPFRRVFWRQSFFLIQPHIHDSETSLDASVSSGRRAAR
jgi:hypothetical protein